MPRDFRRTEEDKKRESLRGLPPEAQGRQVEFIKKQMTELLAGCGRIDLLWFDQYNADVGKQWTEIFAFPEAHRKRLRTSNACENVNGQIKKRTRVVGLLPSEESLLRLVTGVLIEISETWETGKTYLSLN